MYSSMCQLEEIMNDMYHYNMSRYYDFVSGDTFIIVRVWFVLKCLVQATLFEPPRGKTNNVVSEQVRHKQGCTSTEKS